MIEIDHQAEVKFRGELCSQAGIEIVIEIGHQELAGHTPTFALFGWDRNCDRDRSSAVTKATEAFEQAGIEIMIEIDHQRAGIRRRSIILDQDRDRD